MPRTTKDSHEREGDEAIDDANVPRVDEIEPDERSPSRFDEDSQTPFDDDDLVEDIDLDDLAAMEGPDA